MAKKYLSLDEAAQLLGIAKDQLVRFREQGEIRGFADRGSWKFREEDVEEFLRTRQTDSSPDFPIIADDESSVLDDDHSDDLSSSDSDVRLYFDESLFADDEEDLKKLKDSDSDVQLTGDSGPKLETDSGENLQKTGTWEPTINLTDSDSDVKLVGARTDADIDLADLAQTTQMSDSTDMPTPPESGVLLSDSDSDVRLAEKVSSDDEDEDDSGISLFEDLDSDSDVKLTGLDGLFGPDSDSDVQLSGGLNRTDSDIRLIDEPLPGLDKPKDKADRLLAPDDSDLKLIDSGSRVRKDEDDDSGITLESQGSSLALEADESGISLEIDSGISLEADDSGISLESFDSGASLDDDSGISLDGSDSGISLDLGDDSGISLGDEDQMGRTMPMGSVPNARSLMEDSTEATTQFQVPGKKKGQDSVFNLQGMDDDENVGASTGLLQFDDDDAGETSKKTVAMNSMRGGAAVDDDEDADLDDSYSDDEYGDDEYADDDLSGEMSDDEYADDDFGDDEEADGDFAATAGSRTSARVDVDWGLGTKIMIGVGALLSVVCGLIGVELVRTMWLWTQPAATSKSAILEMIGGLFG